MTLRFHVLFWPIGEQVDNADTDGSYVLTAVVSGGTPKADTFQWELQDGRIINPGYEDSEYATGASSVSTPINHIITAGNNFLPRNDDVLSCLD